MLKKVSLSLALLAACLWVWTLVSRNQNKSVKSSESLPPLVATDQVRTGTSQHHLATSEANPESSAQGAMANTNQIAEAEIRSQVVSQNIPIEFHGKIVDQEDKPLPDVNVRASIRHWEVVSPIAFGAHGQMISGEATTASDGRFLIQGMTGDSVAIQAIEKLGYELEPTHLTYGATSGSFETPIIFRMWATNIHEQLIADTKSFPIIPDGRRYFIDLEKGVISESGGGTLKISVKRPNGVNLGQKYDWSGTIEVLDGGLQAATNSPSKYIAPADGYAARFVHEQKVGSGWGDSTGKKEFFVNLNNGQLYGFITIELFAYYNNKSPGMVRLRYVLNPSGSRILR